MTLRSLAIFTAISMALTGTLPGASGAMSSARADDSEPKKPAPDVSTCAKVTGSAPYQGYGYTHLVELKNTCGKPVECRVWTNVDPEKLTLSAKPGETVSIATRKGSPSRDFTAQSECKYAS